MAVALEADLLNAIALAQAGDGAADAILVQVLDADGLPTARHLTIAVDDPSCVVLRVPGPALDACREPEAARARLIDLGFSREAGEWSCRFFSATSAVQLAQLVFSSILASTESEYLLTEN